MRLLRCLPERLLSVLPTRWQNLTKEASSFAIIGVFNTLLDLLLLNALLWIGPLKAKVIATIIGTTVSYGLNRYWTFARRERTSVRREYVLFFALNIVGLGIQLTVLGGAKYGLGFSEDGGLSARIALNAANIVGILIATVFRFWSYRTFVFLAPAASGVTSDSLESCEAVEIDRLAIPFDLDLELELGLQEQPVFSTCGSEPAGNAPRQRSRPSEQRSRPAEGERPATAQMRPRA